MLTSYQRETFDDDLYGEVIIDHDPSSGAIFIEFERFESDDTIMPRYRVSLTTEHVLAWVEWLLTNRFGRRCKRCSGDGNKKRLQIMLKLTESDNALVYCMHSGPNVILIRNGCVYKVQMCLTFIMTEFSRSMKEEEVNTTTVSKGFVDFVHSLMS